MKPGSPPATIGPFARSAEASAGAGAWAPTSSPGSPGAARLAPRTRNRPRRARSASPGSRVRVGPRSRWRAPSRATTIADLSSSRPIPRRCHASATTSVSSIASVAWIRDRRTTAATRVPSASGRLGDERDLAVVVDEADPGQPLVGRPLGEGEVRAVAGADGRLRQRPVEAGQQRLVLRPDRPDDDRRRRRRRGPRGCRRAGTAGSRARGRSRVGARSAGCSTTRASSAMIRSGDASSGLMSISAIRGCSATSSLKRTRSAASTSRSIGLRPRTPRSAVAIVVCSISRLASVVLSGGSASARSRKTSTSWPPIPNRRTGPNCGSGLLPTISS